jgi:hypothetical protein
MYGMIAFGVYLVFVLIRWPIERAANARRERKAAADAALAAEPEDDDEPLPSGTGRAVCGSNRAFNVDCPAARALACELLGMSANVPTDIVFSFTGLMQRGGRTGPHRDGWGIAFYEGRGLRLFQDPAASSESEVANWCSAIPSRAKW